MLKFSHLLIRRLGQRLSPNSDVMFFVHIEISIIEDFFKPISKLSQLLIKGIMKGLNTNYVCPLFLLNFMSHIYPRMFHI